MENESAQVTSLVPRWGKTWIQVSAPLPHEQRWLLSSTSARLDFHSSFLLHLNASQPSLLPAATQHTKWRCSAHHLSPVPSLLLKPEGSSLKSLAGVRVYSISFWLQGGVCDYFHLPQLLKIVIVSSCLSLLMVAGNKSKRDWLYGWNPDPIYITFLQEFQWSQGSIHGK